MKIDEKRMWNHFFESTISPGFQLQNELFSSLYKDDKYRVKLRRVAIKNALPCKDILFYIMPEPYSGSFCGGHQDFFSRSQK